MPRRPTPKPKCTARAKARRPCSRWANATLGRGTPSARIKEFLGDLEALGIKPHIAQNISAHRGSAVSDEIVAEPGYEVSQRVRKRVEQAFGLGKAVGHLLKASVRGLANISARSLMTFAAYNLVRLRQLLCLRPLVAQAQTRCTRWPGKGLKMANVTRKIGRFRGGNHNSFENGRHPVN